MDRTVGCMCVKVKTKNFIVFNSKTFVRDSCSTYDYYPPVLRLWWKVPHSFKEALEAIINWEANSEIIDFPSDKLRFCTQQFSSAFTSIGKIIWDKVFKSALSKFCGRQPLKNFKGYGLLSKNLLRKSPYSVQIQENTDQKELRIWTLSTQQPFLQDNKLIEFSSS